MKFEVKNRHTGNVQFTAEIECSEDASYAVKLGLAVKWGRDNDAYLRGAYLGGAYLRDAYLGDADLSGAYLRGAYLRGAYLGGSYLGGAYLGGAYLDKAADIRLQGKSPVLMVGPIGSEGGTLIAYKTNKGIYLRRGCFFDTMKNFKIAVKAKHGDNAHGELYRAACEFIAAWADSEKIEAAA